MLNYHSNHRRVLHARDKYRQEANRLQTQNRDLLAALKGLVALYCALVDSGDCGFWNPEDEPAVQAARAAIAGVEETV